MKAGREKILSREYLMFDAVNESVDDSSLASSIRSLPKQSRRSEYGMGFSIKDSSNRGRRGCKSSLPLLIQELIHRTRMKMRLEPKEKVCLTLVWPALVFLLNEFFFLLHTSCPEQQQERERSQETRATRVRLGASESSRLIQRVMQQLKKVIRR